jgi:hypothetical protein
MPYTGTHEGYRLYGGALDEAGYSGLVSRAASRVVRMTGFNEPCGDTEQDAFDRAVYAAIDVINDNRRGVVTSWHAGDASKTYAENNPNVDALDDRILDELRNGGANLLDTAV